MKHLKTKFLKKQIAEDEDLTLQDVDRIIDVHFEFVRYVMTNEVNRETNHFPAIRLRNFGIFFCTEGRKKQMEKLNKRLKDGTSTIQEG